MNINTIKENLLSEVKVYDISEYAFSDVLKSINNKVVDNAIKKFNVFEIKRHILESRNSGNSEEFKNAYSESLSFEEKEQYIKELFDKYTKEDKINECMPFVKIEKLLNDDKIKYFSFYDYTKGKTAEEMTTDIKNRIEKLKEICFSFSGLSDKYYKAERIRDLLDFLKFGYGYEFDLSFNDLYDMKIEEIQNKINESGKIKIRIFAEWLYLSFTDKEQQNDLKNRVEKDLIKRCLNSLR